MNRLWLVHFCWVFLPTVTQAQDIPPRIQDTIAYLKLQQTPSGGYRAFEPKPGQQNPAPNLRSTAAAIRGVRYFGGKTKNNDKAADFLNRCFDPKSGGFADTPSGEVNVFSTAVAALAIDALGLPKEKYQTSLLAYLVKNAKSFDDIRIAAAAFEVFKAPCPVADQWIATIYALRNPDGTYGKGNDMARMTGKAACAVLRLGGKLKNPERVLAVIKSGQRTNGAYGDGKDGQSADLQSSYYVMRLFHMLGELPEDPEALRTFVEKCRNEDGAYSDAPAEQSTVGTTYYAAIILHWLKEGEK